MIKRIIGITGTLAVLAVVAFTILGREHYSSAIEFGDGAAAEQSSVGVESVDLDTSNEADSVEISTLVPQMPADSVTE